MHHHIDHHKHIKKSHFIHRRSTIKIIISVVLVLVIVGGIGSIALNIGFLPIKEFLEVREPIGRSEEIELSSFMQEYPELEEIPNIENINCGVYGTEAHSDAVFYDYKNRLENDGYVLKYEGTGTHDGSDFHYYGFLKGITAVGIVTTSDTDGKFEYDTVVMYTTGNAFDYKDILEWYQEN